MDGLQFIEEGHRYLLDGQPVTGVTTALKVISTADYAHVDPALMAQASLLGQAVHSVVELDCAGELDVEDLDPVLVPYYLGWREFLAASGFRVVLSESRVASRRYGYAGQLDLFGHLNAIPATVDVKRVTVVMPSTGPQTMAYTHALRECRPDLLPPGAPCRRYALQLRPGATPGAPCSWRLHPFTNDAADLRLFLASLTVATHLNRKTKP